MLHFGVALAGLVLYGLAVAATAEDYFARRLTPGLIVTRAAWALAAITFMAVGFQKTLEQMGNN